MTRHYCTAFDQNYLVRGVSLFRSLKDHAEDFTLWVLCYDDVAYDCLAGLNERTLSPIRLRELEAWDPELAAVKSTRSQVEYYFTCSPCLPMFLLDRSTEIDTITYLDADMLFYSSPEPMFAEMGDASIMIIEHRYPPARRDELSKHGIYNVSLLTFRRDSRAMACLNWWRERCLEWCYDRVEDGKFADQKYLDDWPSRFDGTHVLKHSGAGIAPWNWMNYKIEDVGGILTIDGEPLIFYHFHGLRIFNRLLFDAVSEGRFYGQMPGWLRNRLYRPYVRHLRESDRLIRRMNPHTPHRERSIRVSDYGWKKIVRKVLEGQFSLTSPF